MKKVFLTLMVFLFAVTGTMRAQSTVANRAMQTLIEEGFEGAAIPDGWTQEGSGTWSVGTGDYSSSTGAATGSYNAKINHSSTGNVKYLITPAMDLSNATSATVSCNYINRSWAGDIDGFGIYYRVDGGAWNELLYTTSAHSTWTASGEIDLTGFDINYQIGFKFYDNYGYGVGLDDVVVTADIAAGGGATTLSTDPTDLYLGYRPNGAWMAPYTFNVKSAATVTVNALDLSGNYFTYDAEVPATVNATHPLEVTLTTGDATPGRVDAVLTVLYGENRDAAQFNVYANAYDPVAGDVFENAIEVTPPYSANAPEQIYKNYELPGGTIAADAMYKMTFDEDVLLSASTTATDGVAVLYPEDFMGEDGPMDDNYYDYYGPTINPGPINYWFYYDWSGSQTNLGYNTAGNLYFGYLIPAEYLQDLGLGNCAITTVEVPIINYGATYYDLFILKGGDTPNINNLVYYQEFEDIAFGYYNDIVLEEPQFLGDDENIWIMFATDNTRMYCGINAVDPTGTVWYTRNATGTWYHDATRTPVIYTQFLELPRGREVTVSSTDIHMREAIASVEGKINEVEATEVMGVSRALRSINAKAQNNRGTDDITDMFVPAGTYYLAMASDEARFPVEISTATVPAPDPAVIYYPYDGETEVEAPYLAEWVLGDYTVEMQVLLGTQYPPTTALIDWTDYLVESAFITDLQPNQSYFMQVNARNSAGTTMGEIVAFTTPIDGVEGFEVAEEELYPGDAAVFTWQANQRTLKGYNLYKDGALVNEGGPITETTYSVEGLEYNMGGYEFALAAVYDAGESVLTDPVYVYMTGTATISGTVYDQDSVTVIPNAAIEFRGIDEYGNEQVFATTADETGAYTCEVLAGTFTPYVVSPAYANDFPAAAELTVMYGIAQEVNLYTHEAYFPLGMITATEEENDVLVEWDWTPASMYVDFETGDFSQAEFTLPATYPWAITTTHPYEGTYCMKSTCEAQASASSTIELTVDVPFDAMMGFWVKVSSEANYDKFHFYIDGVEQGAALSGNLDYQYKEFAVSEGTHTYKWEYAKDSSVNSNDDCVYVDNICLYMPAPPAPSGTSYNFDNGTMMGWTTIDANNDGYNWVLGSAIGGIYLVSGASLAGTGHNDSQDMVCSGSYSNATSAAITPDNYLVSPSKIAAQSGAAISFWACAQDASYAAEHPWRSSSNPEQW